MEQQLSEVHADVPVVRQGGPEAGVPKLLGQMGASMRKPHDGSEDVKKLAIPAMVIYLDSDM